VSPCPRTPGSGSGGARSKRQTVPGHSGLSCGVWQLLHALTAAAAHQHECKWAPVHDPNRCIGPSTNKTANDIHKMEKLDKKEEFAEQWLVAAKLNHNSTVPDHFHLGQPATHKTHCFKVKVNATEPDAPIENRVLLNSLNHNATMWLRLENSTEQGYQGLETHKIYATVLDLDDSLGNKMDPSLAGAVLYLDFTADYVRNDGGAVVNQLLSGPEDPCLCQRGPAKRPRVLSRDLAARQTWSMQTPSASPLCSYTWQWLFACVFLHLTAKHYWT